VGRTGGIRAQQFPVSAKPDVDSHTARLVHGLKALVPPRRVVWHEPDQRVLGAYPHPAVVDPLDKLVAGLRPRMKSENASISVAQHLISVGVGGAAIAPALQNGGTDAFQLIYGGVRHVQHSGAELHNLALSRASCADRMNLNCLP